MTGNISAEEGAIAAGAQAVVEAKGAIDGRRRDIQNDVSAVRPRWTGAAANSYYRLMDSWDEKANRINKILIELEANLKATAGDQAATEDDHQQNVSRMAGLLDSTSTGH